MSVLAKTIWGEARGESWQGKIAVGWSVRNRVERPRWWGHDYDSVCLKPSQYSCWLASDPNRAKIDALQDGDPIYEECKRAADAVVNGTESDPTGGCTHYKVVGTHASWATGLAPAITIGHHEFYRDVP